MPPDRFEERVAGRNPFQLPGFSDLAVGGATRIAVGKGGELPVRVLLVTTEDRGRARRLKGVQVGSGPSLPRGVRTRPLHGEIARSFPARRAAPAPARAARSAFQGSVSCSRVPRGRFGRWHGTALRRRRGASAPQGRHRRASRRSSRGAHARRGPRGAPRQRR